MHLTGLSITLYPETYMRRLPLREDVNVDSAKGVVMPDAAQLAMSEPKTTTTTTPIVLTRSGSEQCSLFGKHVPVFVVLCVVRFLNVLGAMFGCARRSVFGVRAVFCCVWCSAQML